jgi:hypothetical protein
MMIATTLIAGTTLIAKTTLKPNDEQLQMSVKNGKASIKWGVLLLPLKLVIIPTKVAESTNG